MPKARLDIWNKIHEIAKLYGKGLTSYEIAEIYGASRSAITVTLKRFGYKLRKAAPKKGRIPWNKGKPYYQIRGKKNPQWKGGTTPVLQQIRHCVEYKNWHRELFKKANYACQVCGEQDDLETDHYPKRFIDIIRENNVKTLKDAVNCQELWDISNGRVLCKKCHWETKLKQSN